eukprot:CAMPEP_0206463316 /NCGR_PEP_ID=MMETSP0324_2-20121206/26522_1 /ASSEMBLY_ACC=CAM_ASM_000836 /TAXON_ID=2866 /ORGANISM="Crypthecodinium cohnii, Strain Seligo" /LENGTH=353 /DNA_ID=CAMNT_0053935681 /DNA_START=74 /DNA_END=1135 /DNA_ORIENTATION=+
MKVAKKQKDKAATADKEETTDATTSGEASKGTKRKQPVTEGGAETKKAKKANAKKAGGKSSEAEAPKGSKPDSGTASGEKASKKKKNKKKKKSKGGLGGEEVDEDKKRAAQREIQQLVLKLRKEGKSETQIKKAKNGLLAKFGRANKPDSGKETNAKEWRQKLLEDRKSQKKERSDKLNTVHDLVVIPVLWRGRHDKLQVQKAADSIKACVAQHGVDVWIDGRRQYTPGQKFAHWEHRGVLLRVEVGPTDVEKGVCRLCRAKTPGEYKTVERQEVPLPPAGARELLGVLKDWGLDKIDLANIKPASWKSKNARETGSKGDDDVEEEEDEDVAGNWAPSYVPKATKKSGQGKWK